MVWYCWSKLHCYALNTFKMETKTNNNIKTITDAGLFSQVFSMKHKSQGRLSSSLLSVSIVLRPA